MKTRSGFSLVELMVALLISTLLITALLGLTTQLSRSAKAVMKNNSGKKWEAILQSQIEADYQHAVSVVVKPRVIAIQANKVPHVDLQSREYQELLVPVLVAYEVFEKDGDSFLYRTETRLDVSAPNNRVTHLMSERVTGFSTNTRLDTDVAPGVLNLVVHTNEHSRDVLFETVLARHGVAQ